jgi:hypothetical protein
MAFEGFSCSKVDQKFKDVKKDFDISGLTQYFYGNLAGRN